MTKQIVNMLHTTPISKKAPDLWCVKYLKGFKWNMLSEKVAYERRVKEGRVREWDRINRIGNQVFRAAVEDADAGGGK